MARKKSRAVEEDVEYEKQTWNIYSMMMLLSLLAVIIGCIFLVLELKAYEWKLDGKGAAVDRPAATSVSLFERDAVA